MVPCILCAISSYSRIIYDVCFFSHLLFPVNPRSLGVRIRSKSTDCKYNSISEYLLVSADYDYDAEPSKDISTTTIDPEVLFKFNNDDLANFLVWPEYDFWSAFVQMQNVTPDGRFVFNFFIQLSGISL